MPSKITHDRRILLLALLSGSPALLVALLLLWRGDFAERTQWTLTILLLGGWLGFAFAARERVAHPLQTVSNLLSALREEDFSVRARGARRDDPLGDVMYEVNALSETLREQRLGALEATALLRTVMEEINLAVFAFDDAQRLRLVNRAGERLLAQPVERLLGRTALELSLADCLQGEPARTLQMTFPGGIDINVDHAPQADKRVYDPQFAANDAFRRAKRLLKDRAARQRGEVKTLHQRIDRALDRSDS